MLRKRKACRSWVIFRQIFLNRKAKDQVYPSTNNCLVTHAFGFVLHLTCSFSFRILCDLKALGFFKWFTSKSLFLHSPLALAHSARVSLSFMGLWPGIVFSSVVIYNLFGIFFQKSPVSSQLKTCRKCILRLLSVRKTFCGIRQVLADTNVLPYYA